MKTAGRENPNHGAALPRNRAHGGRSEQILLNQVGCKARKIPAGAGVFFLDFYLYRTYRALWSQDGPNSPKWIFDGQSAIDLYQQFVNYT